MRLSTQDMTRTSVVTALAVVSALLTRFGSQVVPFSLLPFVAVLAGSLLGPRLGPMSMATYALMGLLGIPVFASAPYGGISYILKPSFGFVLGFICCAWATGYVTKKQLMGSRNTLLASMAGIICLYIIGIPYLWFIMNVVVGKTTTIMGAVTMGLTPFIIPDLIKAFIAASISSVVTRHLRKPTSL